MQNIRQASLICQSLSSSTVCVHFVLSDQVEATTILKMLLPMAIKQQQQQQHTIWV